MPNRREAGSDVQAQPLIYISLREQFLFLRKAQMPKAIMMALHPRVTGRYQLAGALQGPLTITDTTRQTYAAKASVVGGRTALVLGLISDFPPCS
jgi:hypothetical protein